MEDRLAERSVIFAALALWPFSFLFPLNCYAIPSPDVIVNVFASAGQVLGLLSVIFGASFFGKKKFGSDEQSAGSSRTTRWILGILGMLLLFSLAANVLQYTSILDGQTRRLYTNLTRSSIEKGKKVGDTSLKTLSFSEQNETQGGLTVD